MVCIWSSVTLPFLKSNQTRSSDVDQKPRSSVQDGIAGGNNNHSTLSNIQENQVKGNTHSNSVHFVDYNDNPMYEVNLDAIKKDYGNMLGALQSTYHNVTPGLRARRNIFNHAANNKFQVKDCSLNIKQHTRL